MSGLNETEKDLLTKMLTSHAYREILAAKRFREAIDLCPTSRDRNYFAHIVEEEMEHYHGCLKVADELGIDLVPGVNARMLQDPPGIPAFEDWLDLLLAHSLNDRAGYHVLTGLIDSKVSAYAKLALEIVTEEEAHGENGAASLIKYYPSSDHSQKRERLVIHLGAALRCLGKANSKNDAEAIKLGLKTKPALQLIEEFCEAVDPILAKLGCGELLPLSDHYLNILRFFESPRGQSSLIPTTPLVCSF